MPSYGEVVVYFRILKYYRGHPFKTSALGGRGGPVISDFFGRGLAQDGRPVTFIFKDKVFICFIFENTAFKYS